MRAIYVEDSSFRSGYTGFMMHDGDWIAHNVDMAQDQELYQNPDKCWVYNPANRERALASGAFNKTGSCEIRGFTVLMEGGRAEYDNVYVDDPVLFKPGNDVGSFPPPGGIFAPPSRVGLNFSGGVAQCGGS
jgi:hypothetical protein